MITERLEALQKMLKELLAPVGGEEAAKLLDLIGQLGHNEQRIVLTHFQKIVAHVLEGDRRLLSASATATEEAMQELSVQGLSEEITRAFTGAERKRERKFSVLDGGKLQ